MSTDLVSKIIKPTLSLQSNRRKINICTLYPSSPMVTCISSRPSKNIKNVKSFMLTDWCVNNVDQVLEIFMNEIFLFVAKCTASPIDVYGDVTTLHIPGGKVL